MSATSLLPRREPGTPPEPAPSRPPVPPASSRGPATGRPRLASVIRTALSTTLVGFCLSVLLLSGATGLGDVDTAATPSVDAVTARATPAEARLMRLYDCSTSGLAPDEIPGSALIREPDGRVHAVGFEQGWRIYRQHGPRTLVAVCLRPVG